MRKHHSQLLLVVSYLLLVLSIGFGFWQLQSKQRKAILPALAQTESALAIRVFKNPEHLSPEQWYKENVPHPGNPQSIVIDGYQAIRDGRSVYVSAANLGDDNRLYSNIYLISYSEGAGTTAQKIYDQLLANWQFNSNILPDNAGKVCSNDYTTVCSQDKDCPQGETCLNKEPKPRLARDVKRLADLQDIRQELEDYNYQAGSFPTLSSGTYIPKLSFSVWPSWEKTLGQNLSSTLPADPINRLMGCTNPYDPTTCWDNKNLAFSCPLNYFIYAYQSPTLSGDQAKLYTKLEYRDQSWASTLDILTNPQELLANCQLNFGQNTNDYDNDTVPNGDDNCPTIPNTTQADADNDKIGEVCDACPNDAQNDQDNDGYCVGLASLVFGDKKNQDNCPTVYNPSQQPNPDNPSVGLACSRCLDADHDSYCSYETGGDDCNDNNAAIHPGAPELPNGLDDNCNGKIDECSQVGLTQPCYTGSLGTEGVGICKGGVAVCKTTDLWGPCLGEITPQTERCDPEEIDSDCDGNPNNGCDLDGDGWCAVDSGCTEAYGTFGDGCPNGCCDADDNDPFVLPANCVMVNDRCKCNLSYINQIDWSEGVGVNIIPNLDWLEINPIFTPYTPYVWVASSGNNSVYRINADNNTVAGPFAVGSNPSRTAVDIDNRVWVANRDSANVSYLDTDGSVIRVCSVGNGPRAVAVDRQGFVWVGNYSDGTVYKLDPANCNILENINVGGNPYGGAIDGLGNLWISNRGAGRVDKINTQTALIECSSVGVSGPYGIAIDKNSKVWLALYEGQGVVRIGQNCQIEKTINFSTNGRAVAVDKDNNIWVTHTYTDSVTKLDNNGNVLNTFCTDPTTDGDPSDNDDCNTIIGGNPIGITATIDISGDSYMWIVNYTTARATKLRLDGSLVTSVQVGVTPYTYSDMAGYMLKTVTYGGGIWTVKVDSGSNSPVWETLFWTESEPSDSYARTRVRSAPTQVDLTSATWSNYFNSSPANLSGIPTHARWLQIEVELVPSSDYQSPTVDNLRVELLSY